MSLRTTPLGRMTLRPLPEIGKEVDELSLEQRRAVGRRWAMRAVAERTVAESMRRVARALEALGAKELAAVAVRAMDDEQRHAAICAHVASRYLGRDVPSPPPMTDVVPEYVGAAPPLLHVLTVVGMCAVNETTATVYLEASLARAATVLVAAATRELLADDVDHARIGWALLASLDTNARAAVAPWVKPMLAANLARWRERPPEDAGSTLAAHGCLSAADVDAAALAAIRDLILPGFESLHIDTTEARAWLSAIDKPID